MVRSALSTSFVVRKAPISVTKMQKSEKVQQNHLCLKMVRSTLLDRFTGASLAEIWMIFQKTWFLISFEVIFWNLRKLLMFARTLKYFCSFFWVLIIFWIEFPSLISSVLVREVLPPMLSCCSARLRTHQCQCRRRVLRTPPLWSLKSRECPKSLPSFWHIPGRCAGKILRPKNYYIRDARPHIMMTRLRWKQWKHSWICEF